MQHISGMNSPMRIDDMPVIWPVSGGARAVAESCLSLPAQHIFDALSSRFDTGRTAKILPIHTDVRAPWRPMSTFRLLWPGYKQAGEHIRRLVTTLGDTRRSIAFSSALVMAMFAIWGLSHRLYETVFPEFVAALSLSDVQVSIAHWVRSLGYIFIAIPSAIFLRSFGYKAGVIGGLGCFAIAMLMFYPAETQHSYVFFVLAGLLANCGVALLEIAADPWVMRIGSGQSAVRRLNIAQTFNPLGLLVGMGLGSALMSPTLNMGQHAMIEPYLLVGLGVLLFAYLIDKVKFSAVATEREPKGEHTLDQAKALLKLPAFRFGLLALALYIAGHTVLWGFAARYGDAALPSGAPDLLSWTLYAFIAGQVIGSGLMYRFAPLSLLIVFACAAAILTALAAFAHGWFGIGCIVAASFFMSILFPTIFGLVVEDMGKEIKTASALLIMASGSANLIPPTIALFAGPGYSPAFVLLPSLCFAAIAGFAVAKRNSVAATAVTA